MEYTAHYNSPLGRIILTGDGDALTGLRFEDPAADRPVPDSIRNEKATAAFEETMRWLDLYFGGRDPGFTPKMNLRGTAFRRTVWEILLTVPYGTTVTYGEIAARAAGWLNLPRTSARAVGGAAGHNPILLIIPCHRVIGADGSLTGYAGGVHRKAWLLDMEKAPAGGNCPPRGDP